MTYFTIKEHVTNLATLCGRKGTDIHLVAVSKSRNIEEMKSVYEAGGREFGESRVQEVVEKKKHMPENCRWHFIGTVQSNKIAKCIGQFCLIHSVDHSALAKKLSRASQEKNSMTSILLQVNTSGESAKHGLSKEQWEKELDSLHLLSHLRIEGLMTMAPLTEDVGVIRKCFRELYELREAWRKEMKEPLHFTHLSMGMSQDYPIAIEEGATILRIGSAIFS